MKEELADHSNPTATPRRRAKVKVETDKAPTPAKRRSTAYKPGERSRARILQLQELVSLEMQLEESKSREAVLAASLSAKENEMQLLESKSKEAVVAVAASLSAKQQELQHESQLEESKSREAVLAASLSAKDHNLEMIQDRVQELEATNRFLTARVNHFEDFKDYKAHSLRAQSLESWAMAEAVKRLEMQGFKVLQP